METFERMIALKEEGRFQEINRPIPYTSVVDINILKEFSELTTVMQQTNSKTGNQYVPADHGCVVGGLLKYTAILEVLIEGE